MCFVVFLLSILSRFVVVVVELSSSSLSHNHVQINTRPHVNYSWWCGVVWCGVCVSEQDIDAQSRIVELCHEKSRSRTRSLPDKEEN